MRLTYRIDRKDHIAFMRHHLLRSPNVRRLYSVMLTLGILAVSFQSYYLGTDFQSTVVYLGAFILLAVLGLLGSSYVTVRSSIRRTSGTENNGLVGDHCFIVDDAAVCEQAGPLETRVKWIGIHKVSVGEDHAFIYFNSQTAFIVPKRAFADESDFSEFVRDCVSRLPEKTLNPRLYGRN